MGRVTHEPRIDFDHHSPEFAKDTHGILAGLRATCPVAWSEHYDGFWVISDWEGNREVLRQDPIFTPARLPWFPPGGSLTIPKTPGDVRSLPIELTTDEHAPLRRLLNAVTSPAASNALLPRIEHWTTHFIDQVIESGECDFVYDLATPIPAYITLEWVGYPLEHAEVASTAMHDTLGQPPGSDAFNRAVEAMGQMHAIIAETVVARRANPKDDIISYLCHTPVEGRLLSDREATEMAFTLVGGGVDSTTSLASSALMHLHRDRSLRQRLIDEPGLLAKATEEFLRVYPPFASIARTVVTDTELKGCPMAAGDRVYVSRYAANFDASVFDDAEEFIPDRFPNHHVSFGLGPHRCAGSHIARLMFQEIMRQVLTRMGDYELFDDRCADYPDHGFSIGWVTMPGRFTPGARS
ncbi:MAG: cytochrome P450 [Acidimicrobiia bacterium]